MTARGRARLKSVPTEDPPQPDFARDIYADARAAALDHDRWRRLHERSDLGPAINVAAKVRRLFAMKGGGCRQERGGFKFEERA